MPAPPACSIRMPAPVLSAWTPPANPRPGDWDLRFGFWDLRFRVLARRRRIERMRAFDRSERRVANGIGKWNYGRGNLGGHFAETKGQRRERWIENAAAAAHGGSGRILTLCIALRRVPMLVQRTHLPGRQSFTAVVIICRGRRCRCAAVDERCGGDDAGLKHQPDRRNERQAAAHWGKPTMHDSLLPPGHLSRGRTSVYT